MSVKKSIALVLLALVAGCAGTKEIRKPPETYFKQGQDYFAKKKYEQAIEEWKKVKETYRSPALSTAAELLIADAEFADGKYIEAAADYENFRKMHPNSEKAPYALYKLGLTYYQQIEKIDVDQTPVKNAVNTFQTFLKDYPGSEYAEKVTEKLQDCKVKESQYEIYVGRFYFRTEKYESAITRLKEAMEKYPSSPANDEALFYLGQAYIRTGEKEKGKETLGRLVKEYGKSKLAAEAKKVLAKT
jgi:outer membrane protein assembly factor BamD